MKVLACLSTTALHGSTSVCLLFGGLLVQYLSSKNTVRDAEIDGGLMAILYRDYFDSVKIPTEINLTQLFAYRSLTMSHFGS